MRRRKGAAAADLPPGSHHVHGGQRWFVYGEELWRADPTFSESGALPPGVTLDNDGHGTASLSESGALPSGVTFTDNRNGTGTLSGTPAAGSSGVYDFTITASGHGKFRTTGRYSSATVRGTVYTVADKCNGTLTRVIRDTVLVDDFVRHKTILLRSGQSYLARPIVSRP
jgi:Putative Ig domain